MSKLVLVRTPETMTAGSGLLDGADHADLSGKGTYQARAAGMVLAARGVQLDLVYGSEREQDSAAFDSIKVAFGLSRSAKISFRAAEALDDRHYGRFWGRSEHQLVEEVGYEARRRLDETWDEPVADIESLQQIHARVLQFHFHMVLPLLKGSKNVGIITGRDPLRVYMKELNRIPEDELYRIAQLGAGEMALYAFNAGGELMDGEVIRPLRAERP